MPDSENDARSLTPPTPPSQDWFLSALVTIMNSLRGAGLGITLQVGGLLVTGQLASGADYLEETGEGLDAALTGGKRDSIAKAMGELAEKLYSNEKQAPGYIHIRNARFFKPGANGIPQESKKWWRGRLSEVDGFIIGAMQEG
ncbi:MAG TPA: gas vesicle accessory protein GvpU [Polyangiaceae bacterium]|nr:gas vesicle accessory protein GvpU [Polyangiaceae bacterium]